VNKYYDESDLVQRLLYLKRNMGKNKGEKINMKGKTKLFSLVLLMLFSLMFLAACTEEPIEEPTPDVPLLTDGVFDGTFSAAGFGTTINYIKFYPTDEVSGRSIYYLSVSGDQEHMAGYYTIEEVGYDYQTWYSRDDRLSIAAETFMLTGTSTYTITLYDFSDNELTSFGYDIVNYNGIIYNFNMEDYPDFIQRVCFYQKIENLSIYEETNIPIHEFVVADNADYKLNIYHNGTYEYITDTTKEGTWSLNATGTTYVLYNDDESSFASVGVSSDGQKATLLPSSGTKVNLIVPVSELMLTYTGRDTNHIMTDATTLDITLYMYTDNTAEIEVQYGGVALEGTWDVESNIYVFYLEGDEITFNSGSANEDNTIITINVTNSYNDVTGNLVFNLEG